MYFFFYPPVGAAAPLHKQVFLSEMWAGTSPDVSRETDSNLLTD